MKKAVKIVLYSSISIIFVLVIWLVADELRAGLFNNITARILPANLLQETVPPVVNVQIIPENQNPIRDWSQIEPEISTKSAICIETNQAGEDKVLFRQDGETQLPIASLAKLMTAVIVLENYNLNKVTVISQEAVDQIGEQGLLSVDEMLSFKNLLDIMLVESSNDAAYSLAEEMGVEKFVKLMNGKAEEIGLSETEFEDPAGLGSKNVSTIEDLVKLTKYISEKDPEIWQISLLNNYRLLTPQNKLHHVLSNTNEFIGKLPNMLGGKTGNTTEARGCLLLVVNNPKNNSNLIYIVLGSNDRFGEMQKLIDWVNQAYTWQ